MPETASAGTAHDADSAQLPQSIRPVAASRQAGGLVLREASPTAGRSRPCGRRRRRSSPSGRCRADSRSAVVSTLKRTVSPWLTLMSVAKPWMLGVARAVDVPFARAGCPASSSRRRSGSAGGSHGAAAADPARNATATQTNRPTETRRTVRQAVLSVDPPPSENGSPNLRHQLQTSSQFGTKTPTARTYAGSSRAPSELPQSAAD